VVFDLRLAAAISIYRGVSYRSYYNCGGGRRYRSAINSSEANWYVDIVYTDNFPIFYRVRQACRRFSPAATGQSLRIGDDSLTVAQIRNYIETALKQSNFPISREKLINCAKVTLVNILR